MFWKKKNNIFDTIKAVVDGFGKMSDVVGKTEKRLTETLHRAERIVLRKLKRFKRVFFFTLLGGLFMLLSIVFIVLGVIIFLTNFWPVEYILLVFGVIFLYLALLFNWGK